MRAITAYELTHVDTPVDRSGLQFKHTPAKTIGQVRHGRQPVVWTALEAGSEKNKWPEEPKLSARASARAENGGAGLSYTKGSRSKRPVV